MKSFEPAVRPVTATSAPGSLPTVAGTTSERSTSSERSEAASVPLPLTESGDDGDGLVGADLDVRGLGELAGGERAVVQLLDRGLDRRGGDVVGLDHGRGGHGAAGEGGLEAVVGLDDRLAARVAVEARVLELDAERGDAEGDEQAAGEHGRQRAGA